MYDYTQILILMHKADQLGRFESLLLSGAGFWLSVTAGRSAWVKPQVKYFKTCQTSHTTLEGATDYRFWGLTQRFEPRWGSTLSQPGGHGLL